VGKVNNLVVHGELLAVVTDDQNAHGARATAECLLQARPEVALVNDAQTLLDLAGLGHGDELTVIANVDEAVLLENGAEQAVKNDRRARVRDHAGLLMQLLGEQVHTEVTVLTGLGGRGDPDDLAGAVLQDHQVANADVVAGDGEGAGLASVDGRDVSGAVAMSVAVIVVVLVVPGSAAVYGHVFSEMVELSGRTVVTMVSTGVGVLVVNGVSIVLAHL